MIQEGDGVRLQNRAVVVREYSRYQGSSTSLQNIRLVEGDCNTRIGHIVDEHALSFLRVNHAQTGLLRI